MRLPNSSKTRRKIETKLFSFPCSLFSSLFALFIYLYVQIIYIYIHPSSPTIRPFLPHPPTHRVSQSFDQLSGHSVLLCRLFFFSFSNAKTGFIPGVPIGTWVSPEFAGIFETKNTKFHNPTPGNTGELETELATSEQLDNKITLHPRKPISCRLKLYRRNPIVC